MPTDLEIRRVLAETCTIAVVGASANPGRASHRVLGWLVGRGYRVFAINPGLSGTLLGAPVYAHLADVPEAIDMVDVFRSSDAVAPLVEDLLMLSPRPKVLWLQLGVIDAVAAARSEQAGVRVVMDRCPVIEAGRLGLN